MSYQKIVLLGNLGKDPEMRYTPDGKPVTNFNLATNEKWKDKEGNEQKITTWWRVAAWGRQAEIANEYLRTGKQVLIECVMNPDRETGGPKVFEYDGKHRANYEVTLKRLILVGGGGGNGQTIQEPSTNVEYDEEDIPF